MGTPWGYGPKEFTVPGGQQSIVQLRVPHRGEIKAINLKQIDGANAGVFEIFDSHDVAEGVIASSSSSSGSAIDSTDPAVNSVTGPLVITAGAYADNAVNKMYINRDGTSTNPVRRLWMRIDPTGPGQLTYSLSMTIEMGELSS